MTWTPDSSDDDQGGKIRWELVPYTSGRGVDLGSGPVKVFPHFIGVDINDDYVKVAHALRPDFSADCTKLDLFANESMDFAFSSFLLQFLDDYPAALREWWRTIKPGGHLCLYLPHRELGPMAKGQKHEFLPADIERAMLKVGSWDLLEDQVRDEDDEFAFFQVYKKLTGTRHRYSCREPKPQKTCAVVRYGAFGDAIQTASVFPGLKRQGYHVTLFTSANAYKVVSEDPHVDRFVVQAEHQVPNLWLGDYWKSLAKKYDRFVNLSESVEGTLLALAGRPNHGWPQALRHKYMDRNYLEWTHELAQVPFEPGKGATFYATDMERAWAKSERKKMGPFVVLWSLSGSSVHKVWPYMDAIIASLMLKSKAHVVLAGGDDGILLEAGWEQEPRVHCTSGKWSIRQSMAFAEVADLVVGTETGLMNAAAYLPVPKIITLSHSSINNLTRDWVNCTSLYSRNTPCYPCHQLHTSFEFCARDFDPGCAQCKAVTCQLHTGTARCAADISAAEMWQAIEPILLEAERKRA